MLYRGAVIYTITAKQLFTLPTLLYGEAENTKNQAHKETETLQKNKGSR